MHIVHFFNTVSTDTRLFPEFVLRKYELLMRRARKFREGCMLTERVFHECQLEWLRATYARGSTYGGSSVIRLSSNPMLKALVVRVK